MASTRQLLLLVLVVFLLFSDDVCHALNPNCPTAESIAPACYCRDMGDGPMMICSGVMNEEELIVPIKQTEDHDMFALSVHDSSLMYFPSHLFRDTHFKKIRLVGTQLMSLAETDFAFEGLEDSLEEFRVMESHYITQWSWDQLANLNKIDLIDIDWVSLGSVNEPFPPLKTITALGLTRADIAFIVDSAFAGLENLRILTLRKNDISELSRGMFPSPAEHLAILDLSDNQLSNLPLDIFEGMPSLQDLNLKNNDIKTMSEAFSPVMAGLHSLLLGGNELRCDCRMRWIVSSAKPQQFDAKCAQPEALRGESVKYLQTKHLWCF